MNLVTTEITNKLSYEQWTAVTQSIPFLVIIAFIWFVVGLLLYLIIAGNIKARTSDGRKLKSSMLSHGNALIPIIIWLIEGALIVSFIIFPFWINLF